MPNDELLKQMPKICDCELRNRQWNGFGKCLTCGWQYGTGGRTEKQMPLTPKTDVFSQIDELLADQLLGEYAQDCPDICIKAADLKGLAAELRASRELLAVAVEVRFVDPEIVLERDFDKGGETWYYSTAFRHGEDFPTVLEAYKALCGDFAALEVRGK